MWHLSAASCPLFNTSLTYIIGCYGNVAYSRFTSSSMCSTNFSIQPFPQYFFNGSGTSPWAKVLCTRHPYGTYVFYLFRIWCLAFVLSAFIVFILSLYHPSTGFKILSKSAYSINGTLNWYCPSWNFSHFSISGHLGRDVSIAAAVLIMLISSWLCPKTVEAVHAKVIYTFVGYI